MKAINTAAVAVVFVFDRRMLHKVMNEEITRGVLPEFASEATACSLQSIKTIEAAVKDEAKDWLEAVEEPADSKVQNLQIAVKHQESAS